MPRPVSLYLPIHEKETVTRPTKHFMDASKNPPASEQATLVASDIVTRWAANSRVDIRPLAMANGGMAPFAADVAGKQVFIKSQLPQTLAVPALRQEASAKLAEEAARADWAASLGIAPKVLFVDPDGEGFITEMSALPTLDPAMARGSAMPVCARRFAQLHDAPSTELLAPKKHPWFHDIDTTEALISGSAPRRVILNIQQLEQGITETVAKMPFVSVPCHNDLKVRNILATASDAVIIDWDRASLADPMRDLAYHAVSADIIPSRAQAFLTHHQLNLSQPSSVLGLRPRSRYDVHAMTYYIKNWAFYGQWSESRDVSRYFGQHMLTMSKRLAPTLAEHAGLHLRGDPLA